MSKHRIFHVSPEDCCPSGDLYVKAKDRKEAQFVLGRYFGNAFASFIEDVTDDNIELLSKLEPNEVLEEH